MAPNVIDDIKCHYYHEPHSIVPVHPMCHYIIEVLSGNEAVVIEIGFLEHFLQLVVGHIFSKILGDSF